MKDMQELIAAAKVISEYGSKCKSANCQVDRCHQWRALYVAIESADLARASEGGWIDCKDRFPDYGGKYLDVLRGFTDAKIIWWSTEHKFWSHMSNETPLDIAFWMPVPSPPLSVETPNEVQK